jgi:hypothetical protein
MAAEAAAKQASPQERHGREEHEIAGENMETCTKEEVSASNLGDGNSMRHSRILWSAEEAAGRGRRGLLFSGAERRLRIEERRLWAMGQFQDC